jgi:hypothetical protein
LYPWLGGTYEKGRNNYKDKLLNGYFNTENLKGSLKWLGELEVLVFTKSEICPTRLKTVRRGRPEWDDALRYEVKKNKIIF